MDFGRVPGKFRHIPEYRVVTETPRGVNGPTWATREKREGARRGRAPLPLLVRIGQGKGGGAPLSFPSSSSFPFLVSYSYYMEGILVGLGGRGGK